MAKHRVTADTGGDFDIIIDDAGRITDIVGDWPTDGEVTLEGVPTHTKPEDVPQAVLAQAGPGGWHVCYYDGKRTCWCHEDGRMRCRGIS